MQTFLNRSSCASSLNTKLKNCYFSFLWHSQDRASWFIRIIEANKMYYLLTLFWYRSLFMLTAC
jgi:hypothetical protein